MRDICYEAPVPSAPQTVTLRSPRFHAFLVAQFLGAANDNAYKVTLILLILATVPDERTQVLYASLAAAFFPIPFLLFSPTAGYLADRFAKHRVLLWTKAPEIVAMVLATLGFWISSLPLLLLALFLMATQSAFFSPAKYGFFPEVFSPEDLSMANGVLELATNLAILTGSIGGVLVYGAFKENLVDAGLVYVAIAVVGTFAVRFAPTAAPGNPSARFEWNVLSSAREDWREVGKSRVLFYTLFGIAWFSFLGSFFLTLIPVYGKNVLALREESAGVLLGILSIGIGIGSIVAGKLSRGHVEIGLVPLGAVGISAISFHLALRPGGEWLAFAGVPLRTTLDLVALGLFSGFFIVPLNALLQSRAPEGRKGRIIAFSNVLSFTAVLLSAGVPSLLAAFGFGTGGMILFVAALTVVGTAFVLQLVPDFFVRLVFWLLTNTIYRIHTIGADKLPKGGVLFVANHVSWIDWLLIGGACDRMIRFLMYRGYYEWRAFNWFFRRMGVIPVAAGDPPHKTEESLAIARRQLEEGHAVCIFAEGAITRTGNLLKFKRGFERIAAGTNAPIVPVCLEGVWGSLASFERGRFFLKRPKRWRAHITVVFGDPMPPTSTAREVRERVQELSAVAFAARKSRQRTLPALFLSAAGRHWSKTFVTDGRENVTFGRAVARALALRDALFPANASPARENEPVGVL
ncbi:MAG: MFS transporter, partial [Candidatus Binatia bacterium]